MREIKLCLFKTHEVFGLAYFREMTIQIIHEFLGTTFQNILYILADFNAFKYFYVSITIKSEIKATACIFLQFLDRLIYESGF